MTNLIQTDQELLEVRELALAQPLIGIDTEFVRERTYYAKLCLVQIGFGPHQYCVDVLAIQDLQPLAEILEASSTVKVLHASGQDLEVLWQRLGVLPAPLFDTQLAAAFSGEDLQLGYAGLVEQVTGVVLAKDQSRTDWSRRPLSEAQIAYAAADVAYLKALYEETSEQLDTLGRRNWFEEEIDAALDVSRYQPSANNAYLRLNGGHLSVPAQHRLKALAHWREARAIAKDIPRSWVLKDAELFELSSRKTNTADEVIRAIQLTGRSARSKAEEIATLLHHLEITDSLIWQRTDPLSKARKSFASHLMGVVRERAQALNVPPALLATRKSVEEVVRFGHSAKIMVGWRADVIGNLLRQEFDQFSG